MRASALLLLPMLALPLAAQTPAAPAAPVVIPPAAEQIAKAVLPLPTEIRADASVLGYNAAGELVSLRKGTGGMLCLADDPKDADYHGACYQKALEPFMARGRALRAKGVKGGEVDSVRFKEVKSGKLPMPKAGALWQLFGPHSGVDAAAGTYTKEVRALYVIYMPFATPASTGIPSKGAPGMPWLMFPGTPKAHIMLTPTM